ncbi:MAG TPA: carbamoyltransferase HypF [Candidatus Eisenbergiella pullistercoris]|uniref:acylphosphatase n=1 Tax=Candidatus Eisenbergiella pullistercoris TaxID=2838555 RepID=A0A9D1YQI6_9FIRM|nr:carbamoyltransferase HypF [Candidatus Eisenbergiella pullistercoris]
MRAQITVLGVVQGVGFRPFVAETARALSLRGSVCNSGGVVRIEVYGNVEAVEEMLHRLRSCAPSAARVDRVIVERTEEENPLPSAEENSLPSGGAAGEMSSGGRPFVCCGSGRPSDCFGSGRRFPETGAEPEDFRIVESETENGADLPLIPPDLPICEACLSEMRDRRNRRFRYPFISCTACGPRYSILEAIPYDREHISMRDYRMCPECGREYRTPGGRRQHAQTISCRECGPQLILSGWEDFRKQAATGTDLAGAAESGNALPEGASPEDVVPAGESARADAAFADAALTEAVRILKEGGILAVKGIGGYQLACRPDREETVRRLRLLKGREKKPFAVMFPSLDGPCGVRAFCEVSRQEEELLTAPARPIVLLERKKAAEESFCPSLSSESRYLGAFLPYTGLHQLLTEEAGPLVMTSANRTDDPIITKEEELEQLWTRSLELLSAAAWNTRRIVTPLDDSLMRVTAGHVQMLRRSRGFVPSPVFFAAGGENAVLSARPEVLPQQGLPQQDLPPRVLLQRALLPQAGEKDRTALLAFGGDLKAAFCLAAGDRAYLSQYFGDMENLRVHQTFRRELSRMEGLFGIRPETLVCDLHPGYLTTQLAQKLAEETGRPLLRVQHHHAHAASVMAEHGLERCIAVVFDGTGYGTDGHIWGGEFLVCEGASFRRMGHLEEIPLVGGDASSRDAALTAACHLAALPGKEGLQSGPQPASCGAGPDSAASEEETAETAAAEGWLPEEVASRLDFAGRALAAGIQVQRSSSMGRLFDAVSALLGIRAENSYEGECAVALENAAWRERKRREEEPEHEAGKRELPFPIREEGKMLIADRRTLLLAILRGLKEGKGTKDAGKKTQLAEELALAFHEAAADMVLAMCRRLREKTGIGQIALSGGVFANVLLQERCRSLLEQDGFLVYVNEQVPGNDGGICLGQAWIAMRE